MQRRASVKAAARATSCCSLCSSQRRSLFNFRLNPFAANKNDAHTTSNKPKVAILSQDNLFHPLSSSPIPAIRAKADRIKSQATSPLYRLPVAFDCLHSGWPTHASQQEWAADAEQHDKYWPRLKEANEDEHDLRSGRQVTELDALPGPQPYEEAVSMLNWDTLFYTRGFASIDTARQKRHLSKLLSYPLTIGTVLHENSPYSTRGYGARLTNEGLRSLTALRQRLHPPLGGSKRPSLLNNPLEPLRVIVIGARAESSLPAQVWAQLSALFPDIPLHVFLIGPEVILPSEPGSPPSSSSSSSTNTVEEGTRAQGKTSASYYGVPSRTWIHSHTLTLTALKAPYEEVHELLAPFDPYR